MNTALSQQVRQFLDYLHDVRQYSPHTLSNYGRDLAHLQEFCAERELESATAILPGNIREFVSRLHRQG